MSLITSPCEKADDGVFGVTGDDLFDRAHGPALRLAERFAVGKLKSAGRGLHDLPFFLVDNTFNVCPCHSPNFTSPRSGTLMNPQAARFGERLRGFEGAFQRAGIDRGDVERGQALRQFLGLFPARDR